MYTAELGSCIANSCQSDENSGNLPSINHNTKYITLFFRPFFHFNFGNFISSNSPCSSGYATPQQTALTDSMVDTLAWKNLNIKGVRNSMEDSTDTLVDDGHKVNLIF